MTKTRDAAIFEAEDRAREAAINARLDAFGAPADVHNRAAWFERQAAEARLEAGRQDVARLAEVAAQLERDEIQDRVDQLARDRERGAELMAEIDGAIAIARDMEDRQQATETAREMEETAKQLTDRLAAVLPTIRWNLATGGAVTKGEIALLEQFGGGAR